MASGKKNGGIQNGNTPPGGTPRVNLAADFARKFETRLKGALDGENPEMPLLRRLIESIGGDVKILVAKSGAVLERAREELKRTKGKDTVLVRRPLELPGACYVFLLDFIVAMTSADAEDLLMDLWRSSAKEVPTEQIERMLIVAKSTFEHGLIPQKLAGAEGFSFGAGSDVVRNSVERVLADWPSTSKSLAIEAYSTKGAA